MGHDIGSAGFFAAHLLNAALAISVSLLAYQTVRFISPAACRWLNGSAKGLLAK